jgi:hypothetical protein
MATYKSKGGFVSYEITTPEPLKFGEVKTRILNVLKKYEKDILKSMENTVATWTYPSQFYTSKSYKGGYAQVSITTDDEIWGYLNEGTSERWALMSRDWQSKTVPGSLTSRGGYGKVVMRGRKKFMARGMGAQPGIEAREWTDIIENAYADSFAADIAQAVADGLASAQAKGKK